MAAILSGLQYANYLVSDRLLWTLFCDVMAGYLETMQTAWCWLHMRYVFIAFENVFMIVLFGDVSILFE